MSLDPDKAAAVFDALHIPPTALEAGGVEVPRITIYRHDGVNGDPNFNPVYPFKMRGSMDQFGNVITGGNISNRTYAIDIPVVTNASFDILIRCDASANVLSTSSRSSGCLWGSASGLLAVSTKPSS